ncbi:AraC family transcriptional regulator [Vibrio sp. MarTm2]|uniref:helix-turn-helix domain-containing protein n=1 Tax=Vibrio sp. MarTm2 TaxID=2998831 RepID=UPI0022CDA169|nr:AraC family transcriptional regulator [Vibrio sp. MarTm2]MDA0129373.1 AraC family transcriptional regulator [Vibrio sp. MarTm2]
MTDRKQGENFGEMLLPHTQIRYNQPFMSFELTSVQELEPMTNRSLKSRDIGEVRLLAESYCHLPHFTLDWLASLFGVTSKTLYRYFKDHDTSFKEIKKSAVLNRSKQLLQDTDEPVSNIAYQMGYDDVSNFNRAIKAMCGSTPAKVRLAFRQNSNE